ncbi:hypothetical protein PROFUN_10881 [Planoprotostelium fungivorum]|uniref:RING-type domain-containing protein n=1 Tax=Planoprotostelium fungivorum TaxID=1890364 RepID=A0A2P6NC34_9EUKA|nr:hypothetical protein PROFUN_10881 [Planoprotostelium fungivorum]
MGTSLSKRDPVRDAYAASVQAYTTPTGLYQTCSWEPKVIKRLVINKKIAPLYPGKEEAALTLADMDHEECPICFLYYPGGLNRTVCCKKGICTECFFQIRKPNVSASCPFCNKMEFSVIFTGPLSNEEKEKEAQEQQRVLELKIKMRNEEIQQDIQRENDRRSRMSVTSDATSLLINPSSTSQRGTDGANAGTEAIERSTPETSTTWQTWNPQSQEEEQLEEMLMNEAIRLSLMTNTAVEGTRDEEESGGQEREERGEQEGEGPEEERGEEERRGVTMVEEMNDNTSGSSQNDEERRQRSEDGVQQPPSEAPSAQRIDERTEEAKVETETTTRVRRISTSTDTDEEEDLALALALSMGTRGS